jgi:hypothetical protein
VSGGVLVNLTRALAIALAGVVLSTSHAAAQGATDTGALKPMRAAALKGDRTWSFSLSLNGYLVPDDRDYVQPTLTADRGWLHLEGRYNYEDLETASAWIGYNFSVGEKLALDFTPMLGGVFGRTTGIAPGYKMTLSWWKLILYSEGEYVLDTGNRSRNFFYSWSELGLSPVDWLRVGLVTQRTQAYKTAVDIQGGLFVGFSYRMVDFTAYVFNPGWRSPTIVLSSSVKF